MAGFPPCSTASWSNAELSVTAERFFSALAEKEHVKRHQGSTTGAGNCIALELAVVHQRNKLWFLKAS